MTECEMTARVDGLFSRAWCATHDRDPAQCHPVTRGSDRREKVDHPSHYGGDTTYETIKVIEAWGLGFHLGNVVKYVSRAGKKDSGELLADLQKARWYLDRFIGTLNGGE
jgi:hypothetical protein